MLICISDIEPGCRSRTPFSLLLPPGPVSQLLGDTATGPTGISVNSHD